MKSTRFSPLCFLFMAITVIWYAGCKKDDITSKVPVLTTTAVSGLTQSTATSGGTFSSTGDTDVQSAGVCWSTNGTPTIADAKTTDGTTSGTFASTITGLVPGTTYYARAYATNASGTGYGNIISFATLNFNLPTVVTDVVRGLTPTTATCGGNVTADGGLAVTARGVCWSTSASPTTADSKTTDGSGNGSYPSALTGLVANTNYYIRAYATNGVGTGYGNSMRLKTFTGTVTDFDGNVYNTVTIGTQVWMAENLKTTTYNNGSPMVYVSDDNAWSTSTLGAYTWYNNDAPTYNADYGKLYNWAAVNSGVLSPMGWHVPTDAEWTTLMTTLGGESEAAGKMREVGTAHWTYSPGTETNESGFSGLPGGYRLILGPFGYIGTQANWWSATPGTASNTALYRYMSSTSITAGSSFRGNGYSVRCVMD